VIHPDALGSGLFARGRSQQENLKAVLADVFGHGNEGCTLPGQPEARAAAASDAAGGLLFSAAEITEFNALARECREPEWNQAGFPVA
jgi:L-2-hydroxycarboxylate dehydrogenase (NAD+)